MPHGAGLRFPPPPRALCDGRHGGVRRAGAVCSPRRRGEGCVAKRCLWDRCQLPDKRSGIGCKEGGRGGGGGINSRQKIGAASLGRSPGGSALPCRPLRRVFPSCRAEGESCGILFIPVFSSDVGKREGRVEGAFFFFFFFTLLLLNYS